ALEIRVGARQSPTAPRFSSQTMYVRRACKLGSAPESVRGGQRPDQRNRLRGEARRGVHSAAPPPTSLEAGAVPAKKGLGLHDAQDVPPRRGDGGKCDQDYSVEPRHARPGHRALQDGELVAEQGDLREQRPARAKGVRHGGGEHEDGFEHGRSKITPTLWIPRRSSK